MNLDDRLDALFIAIALGTLAVLVILAATAYVAVCRALDTRTDRRARQAAAAMDDAVTVALDARTERRARQAATAIDDAVAIGKGHLCRNRVGIERDDIVWIVLIRMLQR